MKNELAAKARYPKQLRIDTHRAAVRYRCDRRSWVGDTEDAIRRERFFGWIVVERERVGALELYTFDPNGCGGNTDFTLLMDADCGFEARLSVTLSSAWPDIVDDVTIWGPILDFRSAWIAPSHAKGGLFSAAANAVIDEVLSDHSVLVMLAYPLEYTSVVDSPARKRAVRLRQRAMVRHYSRCFGVKPLPGKAGKDAWLWRPNEHLVYHIKQPR